MLYYNTNKNTFSDHITPRRSVAALHVQATATHITFMLDHDRDRYLTYHVYVRCCLAIERITGMLDHDRDVL